MLEISPSVFTESIWVLLVKLLNHWNKSTLECYTNLLRCTTKVFFLPVSRFHFSFLRSCSTFTCQVLIKRPEYYGMSNTDETYPDSHSRHTVGASVGSLVRAAACLARTDTTPPWSSEREPRPATSTETDWLTAGSGWFHHRIRLKRSAAPV